jgi:hypothetical protein
VLSTTTPDKEFTEDIEIEPGLWFDPVSISLYTVRAEPDSESRRPDASTGSDAAADTKFHILVLQKADLVRKPQVGSGGTAITWADFARPLSRSVEGDPTLLPDEAKKARGGWAGGLYTDHHRAKAKLVATQLMTIDIDANGDTDRAASAFASMKTIIHSTYKHTPAKPRCRVIIVLSEPCSSPQMYTAGHKALCQVLFRWGYQAGDLDEGAHDACRLNYWPMHQRGIAPRFVQTSGRPLDLAQLLAANPPPPRPTTQRRPSTSAQASRSDAYKAGALRRARDAMRSATEGDRHAFLFRQAAGLARPGLGCSDDEIIGALLDAFVGVAGSDREAEGERTIRDAIEAGRSGA